MMGILTEETIELQQCARDYNPNTASTSSEYPRTSRDTPGSHKTEERIHHEMASSEAAFVEDLDVEQEIRSRSNGFKKSNLPTHIQNKSGTSSEGLDSDNEDAPLLSPSRNDYGSTDGDGSNYEEEWAGAADFRGLPWWKRPSVGA
jgi:hypothetical protein